ncbi:MAG: Ig-like domain-containing protein [Candidatus Bathyarchaeia archaeon]
MRATVALVALVTFFLILQFANATAPSGLSTNISGNLTVFNLTPSSNETGVRYFTVLVSSSGFNGSSNPFYLQVTQGDRVDIRFLYADQDLSFDNPHKMIIGGYNIVTGNIDKLIPVQEVNFTASQVGSFQFYCIIPCFGMENLQQGFLVVSASTRTAPVSTNLSQLNVAARGNVITVSVFLANKNGAPISGAIVEFSVSSDFGPVKMGQNTTGSDGTAKLSFPLTAPRAILVTAHFAGSGQYLQSQTATSFYPPPWQTEPTLEAPYVNGQAPSVDLRLAGILPVHSLIIVTLGLIVVLSVWCVYALVLKEVAGVWKAGKTMEEDK